METQIPTDIQPQKNTSLHAMPPVTLAEVVADTIDRMHAEFAHSAPKGVAIGSMLECWTLALERNRVPATSVPQCYDAACDTRTRKGISAFMPTVHDLVAEWLRVSEDGQRERRIEQEAAQRHQQVEQAELLAAPPSPNFDKVLAKARARRGRVAA